jgi:hypothetical protein
VEAVVRHVQDNVLAHDSKTNETKVADGLELARLYPRLVLSKKPFSISDLDINYQICSSRSLAQAYLYNAATEVWDELTACDRVTP